MATALAAALALLVAVALCYAGSLGGVFLFDDRLMLDAHLAAERSAGWDTLLAFGGKDTPAAGRPVVAASFLLNLAVEPLDPPVVGPVPLGFRLANLAIHGGCVLALFALTVGTLRRVWPQRDPRPLSFVAVLLWAIHPIQTLSVTYLSQRAEMLGALFMVLALLALERSAGARGRARRGWLGATVVSALLATASKETAVVLPLLLVLYDRAFLAGSWRGVWRQRSGLHAACAATWLVTLGLLISDPRPGSAGLSGGGIPPLAYAAAQANAIWTYVRLAVWPDALPFDFGWPVPPIHGVSDLVDHWPSFGTAAVLLAAVLVTSLWALWRAPRAGFLAIGFFLLLAPSSSVLPITTEIMALHRMYLPLAVLVVAALLTVSLVWRTATGDRWPLLARGLAAALAAVLAVACVQATRAQNRLFQSELGFWERNVALTPDNPRALANLARLLDRAGRPDEALSHTRRAIQAAESIEMPPRPFLIQALSHAAALERRRGQRERSRELLARAETELRGHIANDPGRPDAYLSLGLILSQLGQLDEAIESQDAALERFPGLRAARWSRAGYVLLTGRIGEARAEVAELMERDPQDPDVTLRLVQMAGGMGRADLVVQIRLGRSRAP